MSSIPVKWWLPVALLASAGAGTGTAAAADEPCEPVPLAQVEQLTAGAYLDIQLVDYPAALAKLDTARETLPCVAEPVPATFLADYYLFRGLLLHYWKDPRDAQAQFSNALAVLPSLRWRSDFGQRPRSTFLDAREARMDFRDAEASCPLLAPGVSAYVDGREASQGATSALPAGEHFLQIRGADGSWLGRFFTVSSGEHLALPVPEAARRQRAAPPGAEGSQGDVSGARPFLPEPSAGESRLVPSPVPVYLAAGVSAAALGSAAYFGARYWSTRVKLYGGGYTNSTEDPQKALLLEQNYRAAILADVSIAVALAGAGTAYGLARWRNRRSAENGLAVTAIVPFFSPRATGLQAHGVFR